MEINIGDKVLLHENKKANSWDFVLKTELIGSEGLVIGFYPVGAVYEVEVNGRSYLVKEDVMKKIN